jgi:hypothetical protein
MKKSPLPQQETQAWLSDARKQLSARPLPLSITGPYGDAISVSNQHDHALLPFGMVERDEDRQFVPIELTIAPGVVVPLAEARIYYTR